MFSLVERRTREFSLEHREIIRDRRLDLLSRPIGCHSLAFRPFDLVSDSYCLVQHPVEKRQADVHPIFDVGVVVVEFPVMVPNAGLGEALRHYARAEVDVVLAAPGAIDVDAAE